MCLFVCFVSVFVCVCFGLCVCFGVCGWLFVCVRLFRCFVLCFICLSVLVVYVCVFWVGLFLGSLVLSLLSCLSVVWSIAVSLLFLCSPLLFDVLLRRCCGNCCCCCCGRLFLLLLLLLLFRLWLWLVLCCLMVCNVLQLLVVVDGCFCCWCCFRPCRIWC